MKHAWKAPLLLVAALGLPTSCRRSSDSSSVLIYGGRPSAAGAWPSVVAISINLGSAQSICTGTVLQPTLVVTAAHCFSETGKETPPSVDQFQVILGNDMNSGQPLRVAKGAFNPAYKDDPINDLAYLVLADQAPVQALPAATDPADVKKLTAVGSPTTLVGFGTADQNGADGQPLIGVKFEVTTQVSADPDGTGALFIGGGGKDSCQGDSGGPAFGVVNGQIEQFAAVSRGNTCGAGGYYARLSENLCWVEKDSGVSLPGSHLPCDYAAPPAGTAPAPPPAATAGGPGRDIQVLFATKSSDEAGTTYEVDIAAPATVVRLAACVGDAAACASGKAAAVQTRTISGPSSDRIYFSTAQPLAFADGEALSVIGYDGKNNAVQVRTFRIVKKS